MFPMYMCPFRFCPFHAHTQAVFPVEESTLALEGFLAQHPDQGILRIQAFRGEQTLPLIGVRILVSKELVDGEHLFFEGETDESGVIDPIVLPAPPRGGSQFPGGRDPYVTYRLVASSPDFVPLDTVVNIFPGVKTVQPIQLRLEE